MPNRIVKESITTSATLAALSAEAERFFLRLTVVVDDFGRMDGRPGILRARCFAAMLETITERKVATWLETIAGAGLVHRYAVEGRPYVQLTTWEQHQRIRAKVSRYPEPPADIRGHPRTSDSTCRRDPDPDPDPERNPERGFGVFWLPYPKKRHKPDALKAWQQVHGEELVETILAGLERWKGSEAWLRGYIEDPATFLRQRQWEDAPASAHEQDTAAAQVARLREQLAKESG